MWRLRGREKSSSSMGDRSSFGGGPPSQVRGDESSTDDETHAASSDEGIARPTKSTGSKSVVSSRWNMASIASKSTPSAADLAGAAAAVAKANLARAQAEADQKNAELHLLKIQASETVEKQKAKDSQVATAENEKAKDIQVAQNLTIYAKKNKDAPKTRDETVASVTFQKKPQANVKAPSAQPKVAAIKESKPELKGLARFTMVPGKNGKPRFAKVGAESDDTSDDSDDDTISEGDKESESTDTKSTKQTNDSRRGQINLDGSAKATQEASSTAPPKEVSVDDTRTGGLPPEQSLKEELDTEAAAVASEEEASAGEEIESDDDEKKHFDNDSAGEMKEEESSEEDTSSDDEEVKLPAKILLKANATDRLFIATQRRSAPPVRPNGDMVGHIKRANLRVKALVQMQVKGQKLSRNRRIELLDLLIAKSMRVQWNKLRAATWFLGQFLRWRKQPSEFLKAMGQPKRHDTHEICVSAGFGASSDDNIALSPTGIPRARNAEFGEEPQQMYTLYTSLAPRQKVSRNILSAVHRPTGNRIAVKKVKDALVNPKTAVMLTRDLFLMRNFTHECVIDVQDVILPKAANGWSDLYFTMPLASTDFGKVLSSTEAIQQQQLPWIAYQCVSALSYIHSAGVLHANLKPENFLIDLDSYSVRLYGFGHALLAPDQRKTSSNTKEDKEVYDDDDGRSAWSFPEIDAFGAMKLNEATQAMHRRRFAKYYDENHVWLQPDPSIEKTWQSVNRSMERKRRATRKRVQEMEHATIRSLEDLSSFRSFQTARKREMQNAIERLRCAADELEWERVIEIAKLKRDEVKEAEDKGIEHLEYALQYQNHPPDDPERLSKHGMRLVPLKSPSKLPAIDRVTKQYDLTDTNLRDDISVDSAKQRFHDELIAQEEVARDAARQHKEHIKAKAVAEEAARQEREEARKKMLEAEHAKIEEDKAKAAAERARFVSEVAWNMKRDELLHGVLEREEVEKLTREFKMTLTVGEDSLNLKGFRTLVKNLGKNSSDFKMPLDRDLDAAFKLADRDHSNGVDVEEFLLLYAKVKKGETKGLGGSFLGSLFAPARSRPKRNTEHYKDGSIYRGATNKDGERHGKGNLFWSKDDPEGRVEYSGMWKNNKREGEGQQKWINGNTYIGSWVKDFMNGTGEFSNSSGYLYKGNFSSNEMHGQGMVTWPSGDTYQGAWQLSLPHGQGRKVWKDGSTYEGQWKSGKKHGKGTQTWGNGVFEGDKYVGEWYEGLRAGQGEFIGSKGKHYVGNWQGDKKNGYGTYTWPNGRSYTGDWKDNKRTGKGKQVWTTGTRAGNWYDGDWVDDNPNGNGILYEKGGDASKNYACTFIGTFLKGKKHGLHTVKYDNGDVFEVNYENDREIRQVQVAWAESKKNNATPSSTFQGNPNTELEDDDDVSDLGDGTVGGGGAPVGNLSDDEVSMWRLRVQLSSMKGFGAPPATGIQDDEESKMDSSASSSLLFSEDENSAPASHEHSPSVNPEPALKDTTQATMGHDERNDVDLTGKATAILAEDVEEHKNSSVTELKKINDTEEAKKTSNLSENFEGRSSSGTGGSNLFPTQDTDLQKVRAKHPDGNSLKAGAFALSAQPPALNVGVTDVQVESELEMKRDELVTAKEDTGNQFVLNHPNFNHNPTDEGSMISALTENIPEAVRNHSNADNIDKYLPSEIKDDVLEQQYSDLNFSVGAGVYIAPEVLRRERKYDQLSETWTLGCILAELMSWQPLRHSPEIEMYRLVENDPVRLASRFRGTDNAQDLVFGMLNVNPERRITLAEAIEHPFLSAVRQRRLEVPATFNADLVDDHMMEKVHLTLSTAQKHLFAEVEKIRNRRDTVIHSKAEKAIGLLHRCVDQKKNSMMDCDDIVYALRYNTAAGNLVEESDQNKKLVKDAWRRLERLVLQELPKPERNATGDINANKRVLLMLRPYLKSGYDIVGPLPTQGDLFSVPLQHWSCVRTDTRGLHVIELNLESSGLIADLERIATPLLELHGLEVLNLAHNWGLGGELYHLNSLIYLRELILRDTSVGGDLAAAETLANLEHLDICGTRIYGRDGLQPLRKCTRLRYLNIDGLDIQGTIPVNIGNAVGLKLHAKGPKLKPEEVACSIYSAHVPFCIIPREMLLELDRFVPFEDDYVQDNILFATQVHHQFLEWTCNNFHRTRGNGGRGINVQRDDIAWISHRWLTPPLPHKRTHEPSFKHGRVTPHKHKKSPNKKPETTRAAAATSRRKMVAFDVPEDSTKGDNERDEDNGPSGQDSITDIAREMQEPFQNSGVSLPGTQAKHPDDEYNSRLRHLQRIVRKNPDIKYWWFDFMCAPTSNNELKAVADSIPHFIKCCSKMFVLIDDSHENVRSHLSAGANGWLDGGWCRLERIAASAPLDIEIDYSTDMQDVIPFGVNPGSTLPLITEIFISRADDPLLREELVPRIREPGHCDPLDGFFWDDDAEVAKRNEEMRKEVEREVGVPLLDMEWEAAAEREDNIAVHEQTRAHVQAARDMLFTLYSTILERGERKRRGEEILDLVSLMHTEEGQDDRQTLLELTSMLAKEIRASWDLKLGNPFDWTYTRFGLTDKYRDEIQHVMTDESGSRIVSLNLRACGPLDCYNLGPCLEKLLLLQHLELADNPDLTGDLAALNGLVYLSTLDVSGCAGITGSLHSLAGLLSITSLNISNCPGVTGVLSSLSNLENLLRLDVTGCSEINGDVSILWRAIPKCVVRHEARHTPNYTGFKDDILGAVLEEDITDERLDIKSSHINDMVFSERTCLEDAVLRMIAPELGGTYVRGEPTVEPKRGASPGGWGSGRWTS